MKKKTLYMIGNAHIDPVWLWRWQEGFQEIKATFRSALDRMKEYPDFVFVAGSAAFYEWVQQNDPVMFEEIKSRVVEGRWGIVGGWWVEPDCNIPCGESYIRQSLYGQRYFLKEFHTRAHTGFNVDSFGHNAILPQILSKSGIKYYVFLRPEPHEKALPSQIFKWVAPDGSSVIAYRIYKSYCTSGRDISEHVRECISLYDDRHDELMCFYGVGNHGGGPTKENLDTIKRLTAEPDAPQMIFSTPDRFFEKLMAKNPVMPEVKDELQMHAVGCYTAVSSVKQMNRHAENALISAEKFSALANRLNGLPYPADFERAWKNVLFNQFHDILAGSSIEAAYTDAAHTYGESISIASRALNSAIQSISWNIHIPYEEGMKPIVVFNPHSWQVKANVEIDIDRLNPSATLLDAGGNIVAIQSVQANATTEWRNRLSFIANIPSMGYAIYRLYNDKSSTINADAISATNTSIENDFFRLEIEGKTGFIKSLYNKKTGGQVFTGNAAVPTVLEDKSDTWSHGVVRFGDDIDIFKAKSVRLIANGAVKAVIRVKSVYGNSSILQDFTMYRDIPRIDVFTTVDWREQFKMLKLRFPVNCIFNEATFEIPYGYIRRVPNGAEVPGQSWVDISGKTPEDKNCGISIINDSKYGYDVNSNIVSITVLRSPVYAHHDPKVIEPGKDYTFTDQGIHHFIYSLLPHHGDFLTAGTIQHSAEINLSPIVLIETYHPDGKLPMKNSFLSVNSGNIIVSVIKKAEDSAALVIRAVETAGKKTDCKISLPVWNRIIQASFEPHEIKTLLVPENEKEPVIATDILELHPADIH